MARRGIVILLVLLFFGLALAFVVLYRQAIQDRFVEPFLYSLWYLRRIWRSLNPDMIWGFFILAAVLLILMTFPTYGRRLQGSPQKISRGSPSRLQFWWIETHRLHREQRVSRFSVLELRKLVLDAIAFREQFTTRYEAERWLRENEEKIPGEVMELFDPEISSQVSWASLPFWLSFWPWKRLVQTRPLPASEKKIEAIILYLESLTEVAHDGWHS